ncbi:MAG: hypothetical protein PHI12_08730 [Dehalococcoidales bacterium]|nr:hypothetical protein [Dehalococcoidales bacterium]
MENNGEHFIRMSLPTVRLSRDSQREYPKEVYPFGEGMELFAHEYDGAWHVSEKNTGLVVGRGATMDEAVADSHRVIDQMGLAKFIASINETVSKLNSGMEYDYGRKEWVDPEKHPNVAPEISYAADD